MALVWASTLRRKGGGAAGAGAARGPDVAGAPERECPSTAVGAEPAMTEAV